VDFKLCYRELVKLTCQLGEAVRILWDIVVLLNPAIPVILAIHRLSMYPEVTVSKVWPELPTAEYGLL
jgi:hypothetical protein